jgi:hypothetical protein
MYQTTTTTATATVIDFIQSDLDYQVRVDASVNPKASEMIAPYTDGSHDSPMTFVNYSKVDYGGGLASKSYKPPDFVPVNAPMFFGMDWLIVIRADMWPRIPRLELDDKVMLANAANQTPVPQEQINESHQFNQTTGQWQYDPYGTGWVDTGFKPGPLMLSSAGVILTNDIRFRWSWNGKHGPDGRWSSLMMSQNNEAFTLPAKFQNLSLIAQDWGGPLRHPQIQTEYTGPLPGWHALTLLRGRLIHSTQPLSIDLGWDRNRVLHPHNHPA